MTGSDWEHLPTFVAVAERGSLTAGAAEAGISQPTASRHIQALEESLGVTLFLRHSRGLTLTDEGAELFESARDVARRVDAFYRRAQGAEATLAGTVRISAGEPIGVHALNPCLSALRDELPEIAVEMVIDNSPANLSRREADIAVRMFRPRQLDLLTRKIGDVELGMFASRAYIARHGMPEGHDLRDVAGHTLIGSDRDPAWHLTIAKLGLPARAFGYRCDSILAQVQAVRDGVGIGPMHVAQAARDRELVRVFSELSLPTLEMWLVMHQDLRGNATVRSVFERLGSALDDYIAQAKSLEGC